MDTLYTIFENLQIIINDIVIKYDRSARLYETIDTRRFSDKYISARSKKDTFNTYFKFDREALETAGFTDNELIDSYIKNKNLIPSNKRNAVVKAQRNIVLDSYMEYNNYYRMLWGLPDVNDLDEIFVNVDIAVEYNIPSTVPLHKLEGNDIYILESIGELNNIRNQYPTKEYLNYLGSKRIDPYISRTAKNFTIIRITDSIEDSLFIKRFLEIYEQCRSYFTAVVHVSEFSNKYKHYDSFIALMILVMTIQKLFAETFKDGIARDFFDSNLMKNLFESYKIPFFGNLPYTYQTAIAKKINQFIQYKSTDKVLYDIADVLDFTDIEIFKYFLIKEHKLDMNEEPIFNYVEVDDGAGGTKFVLDKESMYDFYFQKVSLKEGNVSDALLDTSNRVNYNEITLDDPYWFEDDDLRQLILEEEFACIETKYLGVNVVYKIPKMLAEVSYFYRMMVEKKDQVDNTEVKVTLPKITGATEIRLFDAIILLVTLLCKSKGLQGNIFYSPSQLMTVYGFNFSEDIESIRQYIRDNERYIDQDLLDYFNSLDIFTAEDINRVYAIIRDVRELCIDAMANTQDLKVYRAYQKLFLSLMTVEENEATFTKLDSSLATTYMEFLQDRNFELYTFANNISVDDISLYITHIITRINKVVYELQYLYILDSDSNVFLNALRALIDLFKSYTVDLLPNNIVMLFNSRYYNMIKAMNFITTYKTLAIPDSMGIDKYSDFITTMSQENKFNDMQELYDRVVMEIIHNIRDKTLDMYEWLTMSMTVRYVMYHSLFDISITLKTISGLAKYEIIDSVGKIISELIPRDDMTNIYSKIASAINFMEVDKMELFSTTGLTSINYMHKDNFEFKESIKILYEFVP